MVFASNAMHFIVESKSTFMALKCAYSLKWNQSHFLNAIIFISFINLTNFRTFSSNGKKNWFKSHSCHWSHFPLNKEHGKKHAQLLFDNRNNKLPQKYYICKHFIASENFGCVPKKRFCYTHWTYMTNMVPVAWIVCLRFSYYVWILFLAFFFCLCSSPHSIRSMLFGQ